MGKEYIYFWFIKDISDNYYEDYYKDFVEHHSITNIINDFMNKNKFNYKSIKDVLKKLMIDTEITDEDINKLIGHNSINNTISFLEILEEVNSKYDLLIQDKITFLLDELYERKKDINRISNVVNNRLNNKSLEEITNKDEVVSKQENQSTNKYIR